jgi:hypothetical protein
MANFPVPLFWAFLAGVKILMTRSLYPPAQGSAIKRDRMVRSCKPL